MKHRPDAVWRCPRCRHPLETVASALRCVECHSSYPTVEGIPDFRTAGDAWVDWENDAQEARRLARDTRGRSVEDVVRKVFEEQAGRTPEAIESCTRRVLEAPSRLRAELTGWLDAATRGGLFLDLGCGPGMLLAAAAARGRHGIGIDVSLVWLVVAQRLIAHHGGVPRLAAAFGEALPLTDGAVRGVISLDVIEHVSDPVAYLREIDRVTGPGGRIALSTPNRFSLAPEPHVHVWGVGWLPRALQRRYAESRSGMSYAYTRLLSSRETARLLRANTGFGAELLTPPIPQGEIAHASPLRAVLAWLYNRVAGTRWARRPLLAVGAFYRVVGQKPEAGSGARKRDSGPRQRG